MVRRTGIPGRLALGVLGIVLTAQPAASQETLTTSCSDLTSSMEILLSCARDGDAEAYSPRRPSSARG